MSQTDTPPIALQGQREIQARALTTLHMRLYRLSEEAPAGSSYGAAMRAALVMLDRAAILARQAAGVQSGGKAAAE